MVAREENRTETRIVFGIRWDGGKPPRVRGTLIAALSAIAAALVPVGVAQASPAGAGRAAAARQVLVVPARGREHAARALVNSLGGHAGRHIVVAGGFAAQVPAGALAELRGSASVREVDLDVALSVRGDDAATAEARAATSMAVVRAASGAQALQDQGVDGSGVGVALVDSGAMPVEGLDSGQIVDGPDFSSEGSDPDLAGLDAFGHGTHLAGIIAGRDGDGFTGVAPGARIVDVKVADADGSTSLLKVLLALDWVRRHAGDRKFGIRVVNLALGVDAVDSGYVSDPLAYAAEQLWKSGLVVVAAAGNNGPATTSLDIPAADPYVIAVGADDTQSTAGTADDRVASFSARSFQRPPDVVAPGTEVISLRVPGSVLDTAFPAARVGDRFFRGSGTSQATAVVSGLAALLLQQRPGLAPDQVKALLEAGASRVVVGGGATDFTGAPTTDRNGPGHGNGKARGHGAVAAPPASDPRTATTDPVEAAEGAGLVDAARSSGLATPQLSDVTQTWTPAVLDPNAFKQRGGPVHDGDTRWAGRRWSGRTWSGRTWSGRTWSGRTWSGRSWSTATWDGGPTAP